MVTLGVFNKLVLRVHKDRNDSKRSTELTLKITKSGIMCTKLTFFGFSFLKSSHRGIDLATTLFM